MSEQGSEPVHRPAKMDLELADRILNRDGKLLSEVLHEWRRTREKELRGILVRLGRDTEHHRYQLNRLNAAHGKLLARYRLKIQDCDRLKAALRERGFTLDEIKKLLKEPA